MVTHECYAYAYFFLISNNVNAITRTNHMHAMNDSSIANHINTSLNINTIDKHNHIPHMHINRIQHLID